MNWPTVNFTNVDYVASHIVHRSESVDIGILTLLSEDKLDLFRTFEDANCEARTKDSHQHYYGSLDRFNAGGAGVDTASYVLQEEGLARSTSKQSHYAVASYRYPPATTCQVETVNFFSGQQIGPLLNSTIKVGKTVVSGIQRFDAVLDAYFATGSRSVGTHTMPHSYMFSPLRSAEEDAVVAVAFLHVTYDTALRVVTTGSESIHIVFSSCRDQVFTFLAEGDDVVYLGLGDYHDGKFDDLAFTFSIDPSENDDELDTAQSCRYDVSVYPTEAFHHAYVSDSPGSFLFGLVGTFALLLAVFVAYDTFVRQRNSKLVLHAAKSSEIVAGMIPEQFRERMLNETKTNLQARGDKGARDANMIPSGAVGTLAELHPTTTILFAAIVGFAAWTSVRCVLISLLTELLTIARIRHVGALPRCLSYW